MVLGRAANAAVAHAPWLWPLIKQPMTAYFDGRAHGWDDRVGTNDPAHLAALAVAVTKIDRRPERALDLGTGTGEGALFLAREFPNASIRGVDLSPEMIRRAQAKIGLDPEGRVAFKVADASDLPYPDGHFDLVSGLNMPPFFAEVSRVLRHGGHALWAASSGPATPFFTPQSVLERSFRRQRMVKVASGEIDRGTWFVARKGE